MILAVDIGNSDTKLAIFSEGKIVEELRLPSNASPDFYTQGLADFSTLKPKKTVIASVVPSLTEHFVELLAPRTDLMHVVGPQSPWGFSIDTEVPEKTGHDRLANMEAALRYKSLVIVVDAGTATKFDVLEGMEKKHFPGGAIAPGLGISFEALLARTAQLPRVDLDMHSPVLGYNTETALRSGLLHGFASMVDGMVLRLFQERKLPSQTVVVATGGYARYLQGRSTLITHVAPKLTLEGLNGLANKL